MDCTHCREILSADLDGEATEAERELAASHAQACSTCSQYAAGASTLRRRMLADVAIPDRSTAIVSAIRAEPERISALGTRLLLGSVAMIDLVFALAAFTAQSHAGHEVHRHTGFMYLALALGFIMVARQPWKAAPGVLPMAGVLVVCLLASTAIDLVEGSVTALAVLVHVVCLSGLAGAWSLARPRFRLT